MSASHGNGPWKTFQSDIKGCIKVFYDICLEKQKIKKIEYDQFVSSLERYDLRPFNALIERVKKDGDAGLERMLSGLLGIIIAGYKPVMVSDFDRTLTPFSKPLALALALILENEGEFGILTGNIKGAIDKKCIHQKEFSPIADRPSLLKHLHLFPKIASEHWIYNAAQSHYALVSASELAEEIGKRDGNGNILPQSQWSTQRGAKQLQKYEEILKDMVDVFDLDAGGPGYSVTGKLVVDLGSQMDVRVTGEDSTDEERDAFVNFEEQDYQTRKVYLRELYAAYVNIRTGQFDYKRNDGNDIITKLQDYLKERNLPLPEGPKDSYRIPMVVRRAGRTNLEGVILGMDKAWALRKIAKLFDQPDWTIVFSGDELEMGGNDWPVLGMASLVLNVGKRIDPSFDNPFFFTSDVAGSDGLISYYTLIANVLNLVENELGNR